ncbi:MAG: hypothetical protein I3273_06310 [Candidatus Moeniiplasma glomeromycotorum]|nr:hypothetical protein [Candidatus Moeniiplasma glomeromycotorum]
MTDFQQLLNKIKEFKDGIDYTFNGRELLNNQEYKKKENYQIHSSQLKKEARKIMLNGDTEDGEFSKFGAEIDGKWYEYQKSDGNQPDQFTIKTIRPSELEKRKKEREEAQKRDEKARKEAEKMKEEFERRRKNRENPPKNNETDGKKKCAFCGKGIGTQTKGVVSFGSTDKKDYFCATGDCLEKYIEQKNRQENGNKKCDECGSGPSGGFWEYLVVDGKIYCGNCSEKLPKKSELKQEQEKLKILKDRYQKSSNSTEKDILKHKIDETENHIKDLKNKGDKGKNDNNHKNKNNSTNQNPPKKENWGKYFLGGSVILAIVILISAWVISKRKKKGRNY